MKRKILKSIEHNFSHSFMSYKNYFDDGYVVDDILKMSRDANGARIRIQGVPDSAVRSNAPPRVLKSIAHYKSCRPTHGKNSASASMPFVSSGPTFSEANKQVAVEAGRLVTPSQSQP